MSELPDLRRLKVSQSPRQPTRRTFESFDHVIVVVPAKPTGKLLQRIPQGAQLRKLLSRAGGESAGSRLTNRNATGITIAAFTATTSFDQLSWARQIVTNCQRDKPGRIGVFSIGLDEEARTAALTSLVAAVEAAAFKLPSFKSSQNKHRQISNLTLLDCKQRVDLRTIHAQALGNDIARWFTALPPNKLDARTYRDAVRSLAKDNGIAYNFLNEAELEKLGAGAFLAVSQGNPGQDAGIIHLRYRPKRRKSPDVALVGKGVLFDTGGTNLKPFKSMLDMHTDMQGSAVALGTIIGLASLQAPFAIDAWMAVTENRISSVAYKSQDIVRASNGTTIQVIHTDAEGRMVLADTLALAAREQPGLIIDYATLTGSCVAALTENYSGVFSNRAAANPLLRQAGVTSGERVWPFPMDADFDEPLRSDIADVKQCAPSAYGDHILAARFLSRFVPNEIPWIHVDLSAGQHKGGLAHVRSEITGFGVKLTLELLREHDPIDLAKKLSQ